MCTFCKTKFKNTFDKADTAVSERIVFSHEILKVLITNGSHLLRGVNISRRDYEPRNVLYNVRNYTGLPTIKPVGWHTVRNHYFIGLARIIHPH